MRPALTADHAGPEGGRLIPNPDEPAASSRCGKAVPARPVEWQLAGERPRGEPVRPGDFDLKPAGVPCRAR